jgi:hypothetical protein
MEFWAVVATNDKGQCPQRSEAPEGVCIAISQVRLCRIVPSVVARDARRMKTVAEYRMYAEECRKLAARTARAEDKQALEVIARAWERVANEREASLLKQIEGGKPC